MCPLLCHTNGYNLNINNLTSALWGFSSERDVTRLIFVYESQSKIRGRCHAPLRANYKMTTLNGSLRMAIRTNTFGDTWQFSLVHFVVAWHFPLPTSQILNKLEISFFSLVILHIASWQISENAWQLLCCSMANFWHFLQSSQCFFFPLQHDTSVLAMTLFKRLPEIFFREHLQIAAFARMASRT